MTAHRKNPILVTGIHRSGSTWVGKMIAQSPAVGYIQEPFNIGRHPGICRAPFKYWFQYVTEENESEFRQPLADCLRFKYQLRAQLASIRGPREIYWLVRDGRDFLSNRIAGRRPLMKDPLALLSAEWLAKTFGMDVVVVVRHPAAFVGSLKKARWAHPFAHFLEQPLLARDLLSHYQEDLEKYASEEQDIVSQGILLWNIIHEVILSYRERHADWLFVRHKDLSERPIEEYGKIFQALGLHFPPSIQERILKFSGAGNPTEQTSIDSIRRDSRQSWWNWKSRLSEAEIERIKVRTKRVWTEFYSEEDWGP